MRNKGSLVELAAIIIIVIVAVIGCGTAFAVLYGGDYYIPQLQKITYSAVRIDGRFITVPLLIIALLYLISPLVRPTVPAERGHGGFRVDHLCFWVSGSGISKRIHVESHR